MWVCHISCPAPIVVRRQGLLHEVAHEPAMTLRRIGTGPPANRAERQPTGRDIMAFTATPTATGSDVFAANGDSNTLTFDCGATQANKSASATLWTDNTLTSSAGEAWPTSASFGASGSISLKFTPTQSGTLYLVINNDTDNTKSDPVAVNVTALKSVVISSTPAYIQAHQAPRISIAAYIEDMLGVPQPSGLRLRWKGRTPESSKYIDETTVVDPTRHDHPEDFRTKTLVVADDTNLLGGALEVKLLVGPDAAPLEVPYDIAVLLLGALQVVIPGTTVIDDNVFKNAAGGIPYDTPVLEGVSASPRNFIAAYAQLSTTYQPSSDLFLGSEALQGEAFVDGSAEIVLRNDAGDVSPLFASNWSSVNVYYLVTGRGINQSCSDPLALTVELQQNEGDTHPINQALPPPYLSPRRYMKPNWDNKDVLSVTIDITQFTSAALDDEVTVTMVLWGYTNDTLGKSATLKLGPQYVDHTALATRKITFANPTPGRSDTGYTYDVLGKLLSGYSGVVRYDYKVKQTGNIYTCTQPSPVLVNVSLVYSGSYEQQAFLEAHGDTLPKRKRVPRAK
jgi:hypothetical protein